MVTMIDVDNCCLSYQAVAAGARMFESIGRGIGKQVACHQATICILVFVGHIFHEYPLHEDCCMFIRIYSRLIQCLNKICMVLHVACNLTMQ